VLLVCSVMQPPPKAHSMNKFQQVAISMMLLNEDADNIARMQISVVELFCSTSKNS